ncbi:hypothetical protein NDU88_007474 [Pleurodeles waltl]|uniref:Uncharacterized protein n=1 Tax=Pleurodeles waltl TaxID=8319 RepID=A0AAV7SSW0_PLEWA|nr:hypothetical protein NDU88_007474 [Pleurodeles waltl]
METLQRPTAAGWRSKLTLATDIGGDLGESRIPGSSAALPSLEAGFLGAQAALPIDRLTRLEARPGLVHILLLSHAQRYRLPEHQRLNRKPLVSSGKVNHYLVSIMDKGRGCVGSDDVSG